MITHMKWIYFIIVSLFFLPGCQSNTPKMSRTLQAKTAPNQPGKLCGRTRGSFLGAWFDYYERALSYADCEMWVESERDLKKALAKRGVDKRRVYSLGMHLVSDYFPHRELGIAYFYQQKYALAKQELTTSLQQFPTAKAEEYVKRIRLIQLQQTKQQDTTPPLIQIETPQDNQWLTRDIVRVKGLVRDNHYIDSLLINGKPYRYIPNFVSKNGVPVRVARKVREIPFSLEVPLVFNNGRARIDIQARDISGNQSQKTVYVRIDRQGPQISIKKIQREGEQVNLKLEISDQQSPIHLLEINHKQYAVQSKSVTEPQSGRRIQQISIDEVVSAPFDQKHLLVIAVDSHQNKSTAKIRLPQQQQTSLDSTITANAKAPEIFLDKDKQRNTMEARVYIQGEVDSETPITFIRINGREILQAPGTQVYFSHSLPLVMGKNMIMLAVGNKTGKITREQLEINRLPSPQSNLSQRLSLAQFPFACNEVSRAPCRASARFYQDLFAQLQKRARFQLTSQQQLNQLLDQNRDCETHINDKCVLSVAEQLIRHKLWHEDFANAIFSGTIIERVNTSGLVSVEIAGRVIDYHSKEVLTSVDIYSEQRSATPQKLFARNMMTELSDAFPLLQADIAQIQPNQVQISRGEADRLWIHMPVFMYHTGKQQECASGWLSEVTKNHAIMTINSRSQCPLKPLSAIKIITR